MPRVALQSKSVEIRASAAISLSFSSHRGGPMPIYGYECKKCGSTFQTLVRSGETPECPSCGAVELEQQLSLIASPAKGGEDTPSACTPGAGACASCPAMMG